MSLLEMSFAGGVLILAVIVLRAMTLNRLPKGTFLALWAVAAARLLVPFTIPSPTSVYTLAGEWGGAAPVERVLPRAAAAVPDLPAASGYVSALPAPEIAGTVNLWAVVWGVGVLACGAFFLLSYLRCRREFRTALPVEDPCLSLWLAEHPLRRRVDLRQSDRVSAPLTYGLLRPVILLPKACMDGDQLSWVLAHELAHIRHLDALWKPLLALTACVHWFNPLVWCMFVLANRDMELRCDEAVVRRLGLDRRGGYARTLIALEAKKSGLDPFASAFSKNAIEERIFAIMKMKKRSLAAIVAAVVLVCCVGVGFATSAAEKTPYPNVEDGSFTREELDRLASLWFKGYEDMTVAEYQQKMWVEWDNRLDLALIERYSRNEIETGVFGDEEATKESNAFRAYFYQVYEPLTAEKWRERTFMDAMGVKAGEGALFLEYTYTLRILAPDTLTVGEYQRTFDAVEQGVQSILHAGLLEEDLEELSRQLSTDALEVAVEAGLPVRVLGPAADEPASDAAMQELYDYLDGMGLHPSTTANGYLYVGSDDPDALLHGISSKEASDNWDRQLSPYAPFGLTWEFYDPDLDGNGLTMWFQGKEVRSITDTQEGIWITEHTGDSYPDGAVDLYVVYADGVLTGLREATAEEQEVFDKLRQGNGLYVESFRSTEETREFPRATMEDYDSILSLRTVEDTDLPEWASYPFPDARDLPLDVFNQRLLDWANANPDAWDRINCDVIWNDFDPELTSDAKTFVSVTCWLSGTENGQMVRALYTGGPEQDPRVSSSMPMRSNEENGIVNAGCDLYYDISYHIADKSKVTARERDAIVGGMMNAVSTFWQDTDLDALLTMTEEDVVSWFNTWAEEAGTENIRFNPITADDIHFDAYDERGID